LLWDVEQEDRLWFSTEPDSPLYMSRVSVTGPATGPAAASSLRPLPAAAVRPGRLALWRAALGMFAAHPLTGVGPDNYRLVYGSYSGRANADPRVHSNNMYLEMLAGGGLLVGAAFAWLCWRTATEARRLFRSPDSDARQFGVAAAVVAIALHGMFDSFLSFTATYIVIAVVLGLTAGQTPGDEPRASGGATLAC
jgi:O-antigen ligase